MGIAQNTVALATTAQISPAFLYNVDTMFSLQIKPRANFRHATFTTEMPSQWLCHGLQQRN
jgi:hypothetical protein